MKVHVDQDRCQGHGRCYAVAPEVFEPDEIGNGVEVGDGTVAPELEAAARRAVANCPEQAIVLEEDVSVSGRSTVTEGRAS
jgi:ferredoxin